MKDRALYPFLGMRVIYKVTVPTDMGDGKATLYFSTVKKVHTFLLEQKMPVMRTFTKFKQWLTQDGFYEIDPNGAYKVTTEELL